MSNKTKTTNTNFSTIYTTLLLAVVAYGDRDDSEAIAAQTQLAILHDQNPEEAEAIERRLS